jgi:uncharacterized membrane protein
LTPTQPHQSPRWLIFLRLLTAVAFILAGANHFRHPDFYRKIVPPHFGPPTLIVALSGIAEIAGGTGLLIPPLRKSAGWGLIALLIAVFPANIYMAVAPTQIPDNHFPQWLLWARLPFQFIFIAIVWLAAIARVPSHSQKSSAAPSHTL